MRFGGSILTRAENLNRIREREREMYRFLLSGNVVLNSFLQLPSIPLRNQDFMDIWRQTRDGYYWLRLT